MAEKDWTDMTPEEKRIELFHRQKNMLDAFLQRNAISKEQYEKSLGDLTEKMGMSDEVRKMQEGD